MPPQWRSLAWHDQQALTEGMLRDMERRQAAREGAGQSQGEKIDLTSAAGLSGMGVTVERI